MALNFLWAKLIGGRLNYHIQLFNSSLQQLSIILNLFLEKNHSFVSIYCFIQITAEQCYRRGCALSCLSWTNS